MPDNVDFVRDQKGVKFIGADGQVLAEDDVYLHYSGGKLYGTYQMGRHGGAHGMLFPMNFSLELRDDGTLLFDDSRSKTVYKKAS
jgi:hypothetical protein